MDPNSNTIHNAAPDPNLHSVQNQPPIIAQPKSKLRLYITIGILLPLLLAGSGLLFYITHNKSERISYSQSTGIKEDCDTNNTVNVKTVGATGDGNTDDTDALLHAMDKLKETLDTNGCATLYFPPGTYLTRKALTLSQGEKLWKSLTVAGEGMFTSTLRTDTKSSGIFKLNFISQVPVEIEHLTFIANTPDSGIAVDIAMPPKEDADRSLVMRNLLITTERRGSETYFYHALKGSGLTNPLLENVYIRGGGKDDEEDGDAEEAQFLASAGGACVYLRDGYGVEIKGRSRCNGQRDGLDIEQKDGDVFVHSGSFGVAVLTGVRVRAGGGTVHNEATHVKANLWNYDIADASSVIFEGAAVRNVDYSTESDRGSIKIENSSNISIGRNMFEHTKQENANRKTIYIGKGSSGVKIFDNLIDEVGAGIVIAKGVNAAQILNNRFEEVKEKIIDDGEKTVITLLPF